MWARKQIPGWPTMTRRSTFWRSAWGIVTGTVGFLLAFFLVHLPHGPEHWSADLRTAWLADRLAGQHPNIAIVEIKEETLRNSDYLAPVDRAVLAAIVRALIDAEVKVIGLDFIFDRRTEEAKDKDLLCAIKDPRAQIILGALDERADLSPDRKDFQSMFLAEADRPVGHLFYGEHYNPAVISDHVVREMADPAEYPQRKSFAELVARAGGSYREPGSLHISWLGTPQNNRQTFLTLSGDDILGYRLASPLPLKDMLRDKIVLVGGNFPDRDQHLTPFSVRHGNWYPGIFVHAQIVAQLSDPSRRPIHVLGWPAWSVVVLAAAAGGFLVGGSPGLSRYHPWVEIGSVTAFIIASVLAFEFGRFVFPFVAVVLGWGWGEMVGHWRQHAGGEAGGSHDAV
jgi:CHASE2 domain-containing sensor protein